MTIPVIASGGVHDIRDVEALCAVQDEGIEGVICGRSIYEGSLDLRLAQERADGLSGVAVEALRDTGQS
jgi:phosphoribosylformimino-5-aminoimidazole carboxamide ribotide isomerase